MLFFSAVVILGGRNPCVVEVTSKMEHAAGEVVPIPTWAKVFCKQNKITKKPIAVFMNGVVFIFISKKIKKLVN